MFFLYFGISKLEAMFSPNRYADLFYLTFVNATLLNLLAYAFGEFFMAKALSFSLLYIWCKRNPL